MLFLVPPVSESALAPRIYVVGLSAEFGGIEDVVATVEELPAPRNSTPPDREASHVQYCRHVLSRVAAIVVVSPRCPIPSALVRGRT